MSPTASLWDQFFEQPSFVFGLFLFCAMTGIFIGAALHRGRRR